MKTGICILSIIIPQIASAAILVPQAAPYTADANTVLLDHFDASTVGSPHGAATYTTGVFGSAVHLNDSAWISYNLGALSQGTIEFWGKLDSLTNSGSEGAIKFIGSYYSQFFAPTGYIEAFNSIPLGQTQAGINIAPFNWNDSGDNVNAPNPSAVVAKDVWHNYALTWGSNGLHYYIDGQLVYSNLNTGGQNPNTTWWAVGNQNGNGFNGSMDELRISNIQRDFAPAPAPEPVTTLFGIALCGVSLWRRRRSAAN